MIGQTLGHYKIVEKIGEGGMGEVYRAQDPRLDRQVAIKLLPEVLATDTERRTRFEREAKLISQLSHPNICSLFDVGEHEDRLYLVMELLAGETLATRLEKGAMPLSQVLRYGAEIASALSEAHRQNVIHRDLKPGNIILTSAGAKLLDFGLARVAKVADSPSNPLPSLAPTEELPLTTEGTLLGTYPYMSPEQAEGIEADARSDIFALGAVLYEMATGRRAFDGSSRAALLVAILERDPPPISSVQRHLPPALEHIVRTCLEKDPEDRWQDARDIASQLRWVALGASQPEDEAPSLRRRQKKPWLPAVASLLLAIVAYLIGVARPWSERDELAPPVRASLELPFDKSQLVTGSNLALSPDGTNLAFVAREEGRAGSIWVRALGESTAQALKGSEGVSVGSDPGAVRRAQPFWSTDSSQLAFFSGGKLRKIDLESGAVLTIGDAPDSRGGSWNQENIIVFVPTPYAGLVRVPASGGTVVPLVVPTEGSGATYRWPEFLPDGRHVLFLIARDPERPDGLYIADIETGEFRLLLEESSQGHIVGDRLLYHREGNLIAQRFDPVSSELAGPPTPVVQRVFFNPNRWEMTVTASERVLVYLEENRPLSQLAWLDPEGSEISRVGDPAVHEFAALSPDGSRVIIDHGVYSGRSFTLVDTATGAKRTFTQHQRAINATWSPDGRQVAFTAENGAVWDLVVTDAAASGRERVMYSSSDYFFVTGWSADGRHLAIAKQDPVTIQDLWLIPSDGSGQVEPIIRTEARESNGIFSPDGRWFAYHSNASGREELYVTRLPGASQKWQVTTHGVISRGSFWSADSSALTFLTVQDGIFKAFKVSLEESKEGLHFGTPKPFFGGRDLSDLRFISPVADRSRFLVAIAEEDSGPASLALVLDWMNGIDD